MKRIIFVFLIVCLVNHINLFALNTNFSYIRCLSTNDSISTSNNITYESDCSIPIVNYSRRIKTFAISGNIELEQEDGYVVITIEDEREKEYIVYEAYIPLISSTFHEFNSVAMESAILDDIIPRQINLYIHHAKLNIKQTRTTHSTGWNPTSVEKNNLRRNQENEIISTINQNIEEKGLLWFAGPTSVSYLNFEERKQIFGEDLPCLYGFEYYRGGIFTIPDTTQQGTEQAHTDLDRFVKEFDWRKRHGKNWNTSIKQQTGNTCWAFATTATIEAGLNIYYNQSLNIDLSEQDLVSCMDNDGKTSIGRYNNGGYSVYALDFIKNNGIIDENSFPLIGGDVPCSNKSNDPAELVYINSYRNLFRNTFDTEVIQYSEDMATSMKEAIIKAPIIIDYFRPSGHSMSCVGFHSINLGDTLLINIYTGYEFVVDSTRLRGMGDTYWIVKNSYGENWGENGYARIGLTSSTGVRLYEINGKFDSLRHSDQDILVTDEDNDGYYLWGSGDKPDWVPDWVPDLSDGDDSDPNIGAMDEYGNCEDISSRPPFSWNINYNEEITQNLPLLYPNIRILPGGHLQIIDTNISLADVASITIEEGGSLMLCNSSIMNADIIVRNGGFIQMDNNSNINLRSNGNYKIEKGAICKINYSKIN